MVGEKSPLLTHQTGSVAQTSPGSTPLQYVETGLKGFALEFNSLLPGLDSSETGQRAFMLFHIIQGDTIQASKVIDGIARQKKVQLISVGGVFVFKKWRAPKPGYEISILKRRCRGIVFSLQVLLIYFKNSVLSKKNRDRNSSIYLGGYMSAQMMCDILWEGVKVCAGLKCDFLICLRIRYMCNIHVCVCFWVWGPSTQECEFINVWVSKGLTTQKQSRCFNELSKILIKHLDFLQIKKGQKEMCYSFIFQLSFYRGKYRLPAMGSVSFKSVFWVGKWLLLVWMRSETCLWGSFLSLLLMMCARSNY